MRPHRGHRFFGSSSWDAPAQAAVDVFRDRDWTETTVDREAWEALELDFAQAVLGRRGRPLPLRRNRHYLRIQPCARETVGELAEYM